MLSDESFWPTSIFPTFKLRAAIGESGKAPGAFDAVRTWDPVAGDEGKPGVTVAQVGDSTLGPERTREVELGFDASALSDRVSLEATAFHTRTLGTLIGVTLPPSEGFSRSQLENVGTIQNEGIELQLNAALVRSNNLEVNTRVSATWMRNKAVDVGHTTIATGLGSSVRDCYGPNCQQMPVPAIYGAMVSNPDALGKQPIVLTDQYIGPVYPPRILGLGMQLTFRKALTLDAQADYQGGAYLTNFIGYQNALERWFCYRRQQKPLKAGSARMRQTYTADDNASVGAGVNGALSADRCAVDRTYANSDMWIARTDFLKLRNVSLAWNVPPRFVRGARTATLIVGGRNLWRWTKFDGADPEANDGSDAGTGLGRREYYQMPPYKSLSVSIRTSF